MISPESARLDEPLQQPTASQPSARASPPPMSLPLAAAVENARQARRKRRATVQLAPINLGSAARLSASNESLNSSGSSTSVSLSDCDEPLVSLQSPSDESPSILGRTPSSASTLTADEFTAALEKRQRLCSHSSTTSLNSINALLARNVSLTAATVAAADDEDSISNGYDIADLECSSQGSTSAKCSQQLASGGLIIADDSGDEFELVGDGRECKAVNIATQTMYHCQIMKPEEYKKFLLVVERAMLAKKFYPEDEYSTLKDLLVPDSVRPIASEANGVWYVLLPDHQGYLHSLVQSPEGGDSLPATKTVFSERQIQPIFKQIVSLVDFCHRIGLYFHDFRLRKFVFVDKERSLIRLNSVLDLHVAEDINSDLISSRNVCPAYVSPEILDTKAGGYSGKPADIWALGVLLFILLTGRYPFYEANPNPMALFRRIRARRFSFPINENISITGRWLLNGLLRQNPLDRPTAAEVLNSHWVKADSEQLPDGHTAPIPVPSKLHRPRRILSSFAVGSPPGFQSFSATVISPGGNIRSIPAISTRLITATSQAPLQQAPSTSSAAVAATNAIRLTTIGTTSTTSLPTITYRRFPIQYGAMGKSIMEAGEDQLVPDVPEERIPEIDRQGPTRAGNSS